MLQPNVAWSVPGTVVPTAGTAAANGSLGPQIMYSATLPQYQTQ